MTFFSVAYCGDWLANAAKAHDEFG